MHTIDTCFLHALRGVTWHNYISNFYSGDTFADTLNNPCSFMSKDTGKASFGVASIESVNICMAESIGNDFDSNLAFLWRRNPNFFNDHWLFGFIGDCSLAQNRLRFLTLHLDTNKINMIQILNLIS